MTPAIQAGRAPPLPAFVPPFTVLARPLARPVVLDVIALEGWPPGKAPNLDAAAPWCTDPERTVLGEACGRRRVIVDAPEALARPAPTAPALGGAPYVTFGPPIEPAERLRAARLRMDGRWVCVAPVPRCALDDLGRSAAGLWGAPSRSLRALAVPALSGSLSYGSWPGCMRAVEALWGEETPCR